MNIKIWWNNNELRGDQSNKTEGDNLRYQTMMSQHNFYFWSRNPKAEQYLPFINVIRNKCNMLNILGDIVENKCV